MSEIETTRTTPEETEDWAILPFDESEDNTRWAQLIEEMTDLEKKAASTEAIYGKITMNQELPSLQPNEHSEPDEDEQLSEFELF